MEITLEKIELVKDRTGVSYKEAKEALEAAEGSVVDAIIAIEDTVDIEKTGKTSEFANETMEKIKEMVRKGNISKIAVKKGDDTIVNIPVNVGLVGAVVAPWGVIAAALATVGFKCTVELTTTDGNVIDITKRAGDFAGDMKEKSSVVIDEVVEKSTGAYNTIKDVAQDKLGALKAKKDEILDGLDIEIDFSDEGFDDEDEENLCDDCEKESCEGCEANPCTGCEAESCDGCEEKKDE